MLYRRLFSKKITFDELYAGSLQHAKDSDIERKVGEMDDSSTLVQFLEKSYIGSTTGEAILRNRLI